MQGSHVESTAPVVTERTIRKCDAVRCERYFKH